MKLMNSKFDKWVISAVVLIPIAALGFATAYVLENTSNRIIASQSERNSLAWANYIGSGLDRIKTIAAGGELDGDEQMFLDRTRRFGDVFRFKLFSADGRLRSVSDDLDTEVSSAGDLGEHNKKAASVVVSGTGVPPPAATCHKPPGVPVPRIIVPSGPQLAPQSGASSSQTVTAGPPDTETRLSVPSRR